MHTIFRASRDLSRMIKIEHSVFALPWAYAGAFLAARGLPSIKILIYLTIAMVGVRSFAMTFNRIADKKIDSLNPRTKNRPLQTGAVSEWHAWIFCAGMAAIFILACALLNKLCFILAFPALAFAGAYSFSKRFTPLCHYWLSATLGLAPLAGWIAVDPASPGMSAILLACAVTFWVSAFDVYYSFQDLAFDKAQGLHSIPADFGAATAMALAAFSHSMTIIFLFLTGIAANLGWPWYILCAGAAVILIWEHRLVNPADMSNINTPFFTLNGIMSPLVLLGIILGIYF